MSEAKMKVDAMAGFAAPPFHPILTDCSTAFWAGAGEALARSILVLTGNRVLAYS